jgi:serine/threonine protein kinase
MTDKAPSGSVFGDPIPLDQSLLRHDPSLNRALLDLQASNEIGKIEECGCSVIGEGRFGIVYRIEDLMRRNVAVKTLRTPSVEAMQALKQEAAHMIRAYPAAPRPYAVTKELRPYLLMEFLDACTLLDMWAAPLRPYVRKYRLRIAELLVEQVARVEEAGLVHRDLSPTNVMLERVGGLRIVDFGLSRDTPKKRKMQEEKMIAGTPAYMGPEQQDMRYHRRTDVFALGMILFEHFADNRLLNDLLQLPADERNLSRSQLRSAFREQEAQKRLDRVISTNEKIPSDWKPILVRMLQIAPADRSSCLSLVQDCREAAAEDIGHAELFLPGAVDTTNMTMLPAFTGSDATEFQADPV